MTPMPPDNNGIVCVRLGDTSFLSVLVATKAEVPCRPRSWRLWAIGSYLGRGLAIGIASAGQALGQGGVPFTGAYLIEAFGWRNAMMTQGLITLGLLLPLGMFLRDSPVVTKSGALADETPSGLPNAVITVWISAAVVFCCTCMAVPLMHLLPLIQGRGFSAPEAGSVIFVMLMVAIVGRVAFGKLTDIIGAVPACPAPLLWATFL